MYEGEYYCNVPLIFGTWQILTTYFLLIWKWRDSNRGPIPKSALQSITLPTELSWHSMSTIRDMFVVVWWCRLFVRCDSDMTQNEIKPILKMTPCVLQESLDLSLYLTHTHAHTLTHKLSLSPSLSLTLSLFLSVTHTLSLSLTHTQILRMED